MNEERSKEDESQQSLKRRKWDIEEKEEPKSAFDEMRLIKKWAQKKLFFLSSHRQ